jgi:hypothetical protein
MIIQLYIKINKKYPCHCTAPLYRTKIFHNELQISKTRVSNKWTYKKMSDEWIVHVIFIHFEFEFKFKLKFE